MARAAHLAQAHVAAGEDGGVARVGEANDALGGRGGRRGRRTGRGRGGGRGLLRVGLSAEDLVRHVVAVAVADLLLDEARCVHERAARATEHARGPCQGASASGRTSRMYESCVSTASGTGAAVCSRTT